MILTYLNKKYTVAMCRSNLQMTPKSSIEKHFGSQDFVYLIIILNLRLEHTMTKAVGHWWCKKTVSFVE